MIFLWKKNGQWNFILEVGMTQLCYLNIKKKYWSKLERAIILVFPKLELRYFEEKKNEKNWFGCKEKCKKKILHLKQIHSTVTKEVSFQYSETKLSPLKSGTNKF